MVLSQHKKLFGGIFFSLIAGVIFYACDKEAEQPVPAKKATLVVEVMHHQWTIPDISVYLKKDVTEFPGMNTADYDFTRVTNQAGNVQFSGLLYGNYYLFVHGWDPVFNDTVIGYKPVIINDSSAGEALLTTGFL